MTGFAKIILTIATACLTTALAGCGTLKQPPGTQPVSATIATQPHRIAPVRADQLLPVIDGSGALEVMTGAHKGDIRPFTRSYTNRQWVILQKNHHRGLYHLDAQGRVILDREDDLEENVRVDYQPGMVILPAVMDGHPPFPAGKVKMTILNLKTGKQRDQGTCTYAITGIRHEKIKTPAGVFSAYLVESERQLDLHLAKVKVTIHNAYAVGEGTILNEVWQNMRPLGLFTVKSHERLERAR